MGDLDLLVLGELNVDTIVDCGQQTPLFGQTEILVPGIKTVLGSSGAITACGAARLGLNVAMVGVVGDDDHGQFVLDRLSDRGVNVTGCLVRTGRRTGVTVVLAQADGDRAMLTFPGQIGRLSAADIPSRLLAAARHVHVSSYFLQRDLWEGLPEVLQNARAGGATTSVDPNWDPTEGWDHGLTGLLEHVDVLFPNDTEASRIAKDPDPLSAAARLAGYGPTVALKRGCEGAAVLFAEGTGLTITAADVTPAETTGAGDSFNAGFLTGMLADGDPVGALRLAAGCGALSTQGVGGTAAQPTRDQARRLGDCLAVHPIERTIA